MNERDRTLHDTKLWAAKNNMMCSECGTSYYVGGYSNNGGSLTSWAFYCYVQNCINNDNHYEMRT